LRRKLPDELRGRKGKKDYQNDDFYQIRILMYLSHHEEARIGDFAKERENMELLQTRQRWEDF